jgi:hypothetical protein
MQKNLFKLDGKPFSATAGIRPQILHLISVLQKLPYNELLTTAEAAKRSGTGHTSIQNCASLHAEVLSPYVQKVRYPKYQLVWGNAKTIRALRKHKEILA